MTHDDRDAISPEHQKLMDDIIYLRGRILTSYAQVEFLLADFAVKLELKFPYRIADRLKAAKRSAAKPGYEPYKQELEEICDRLLEFDDLRNYMAHGWAELTVDKLGKHVFQLLMYQRHGEGQFQLYRGSTTRETLHQAAEKIDAHTIRVLRLFRRIYFEKELEKPESK